MKKSFFFPSSLKIVLLVAVLVATALTATSHAQSLNRSERRVVNFLADGVLAMTELTRDQQRRFGPATFRTLDRDFAVNSDMTDALFDMLFSGNLGGQTPGQIFDQIDMLILAGDRNTNVQLFHFREILFSAPRSPNRAFTTSQLLRRGRTRRVPAAQRALGDSINTPFSVLFESDSPEDAALILAASELRFSVGNSPRPDAIRNVQRAYNSIFNGLAEAGLGGGLIFPPQNRRRLATNAVVAYIIFFGSQF